MLRVGLTGELGSGKSTVARLLAAHGAYTFSSDETARALMQPGEPVYADIVTHFGPAVVTPGGTLDRPALAALAFDPDHPRVEELNRLIHPAVLAEQSRQLAALATADPQAIAVIESALIFSTRHAGEQPWHTRFDCIVLVTAPDNLKLARFAERTAAGRNLTPAQQAAIRADGQRRLATQRITPPPAAGVLLLENNGSLDHLQTAVDRLWDHLQRELASGPAA